MKVKFTLYVADGELNIMLQTYQVYCLYHDHQLFTPAGPARESVNCGFVVRVEMDVVICQLHLLGLQEYQNGIHF